MKRGSIVLGVAAVLGLLVATMPGLSAGNGRMETAGLSSAARAAVPGDVTSVRLQLLGSSNLASPGLDGQVKPRGQNGDLAVLKNFAYVGGGALFHGAHSSPGRICTDYGGVKVVDLSNPSSPSVRTTISIEDTKGIVSAGTPRNAQKYNNVSVSAGALDARSVQTAGFTGDILAIAIQRCEPSLFTGARIEFWDITNPAAPTKLSTFDPETIVNPRCTPGPPVSCPQGVTPATGAWGIFEDVRMFTRGGQLFALAVTPFSIGNAHDASPFGDLRVLDLSDLRNPRQVATFPEASIGQNTVNGCRTFQGGRAAAPTADGTRAVFSYYDGSTALGAAGAATASVFAIDLANPPRLVSDTPLTFNPTPARWGYPQTATVEGNAADVQPFTGPQGEFLVLVSEDDIDPSITNLTITAPASAAGTVRGCNILAGERLYELPTQQVEAEIVYVGRACPASSTPGTANTAADELLADPRGKIAIVQGGGNAADGCSAVDKARRLREAGAVALLQSSGSEQLNTLIAGPNGGIPPLPYATFAQSASEKLQLVPSPAPAQPAATCAATPTGPTCYPATWERTSSTNVVLVAFSGRADKGRFRSIANATDRVARGQVHSANPADICGTGRTTCRFAVTAGQAYHVGVFLQVESLVSGAFRAAVVWYDAGGAALGETELGNLTAVTARTRFGQTLTPPAGATRASVKFEWTGASAEGTAYADTFSFVTAGIRGSLRDERGEWGAQRIVNFSSNPPVEIGVYRSPRSQVWPPPNDGLYAPRLARMFNDKLAFSTWLSDGLRVVDVSKPSTPKEVGAYVPPDVADPTRDAGAGGGLVRGPVWPDRALVTGVDFLRKTRTGGIVVVSDINAGLYVLQFTIARQAATRRATFTLGRHLRAQGRLTAPAGPASCIARVAVEIQRNGRTVKRVTTRANGAFVATLPDRTGSYRARVAQIQKGDVTCRTTTSSSRRHVHSRR